MLGELNETQINNLLISQSVGRIGCTNGKQPYIVPVTYVFDGKNIYGQTRTGTKLEIMRKNPTVCFQVDTMLNMANWQSVVVFGTFLELKGKTALKAREFLYNHVLPLMTSSTISTYENKLLNKVDESNNFKPVIYRIKIKEKTGRYEKQ